MKLADLDWGEVMAMLPRWEALSPEARMAFVTIRPGQAGDPLTLGPAAAELVAAGFLTPPGPKGRLYAYAPELRPLLVALRAMDRLRPLDGLGGALSDMYVQDQLNTEEAIAVVGRQNGPYHWVDRGAVAATVSSVDWLNGFMAAAPGTPLLEWEQSHLPRGQQPRIASPAVGDALRRLLRALAERPQGVPLREFAALLPDLPPRVAFAALAGGLRYLLLFTSLRNDDDPEAVVGLLPSILRRMGPPPPPPAPVAVTATFESPFRIADMTTVLVDAAAEPIPVRGGDGGLYVRAQKVLAARLVRPPRWAEALLFEIDEDDDELDAELAAAGAMEMRIALAVEALTLAGLAKIAKAGEKWQLAATAQGRAWLALAEGERLKRVLDLYRASKQRTPGGWSTPRGTVDFLGVRLPFAMDDAKPDLRGALSAALLALPAGEMIPLGAFMRHQAELQNPFLGLEGKYLHSRGGYYGNVPRTREGWESIWSQMIDVFLRMRLVPLGGARLGRMEDGKVAFAVTDTGRYLLGGTDEYRLTAQPDGEVVVQPDFEVVFLSAAPRIESELSRLAERTGAGHVGALFRITRASVLRAAESGMTADAMLKTLGQVSRAPVPANVARQVKDWFGGTRRVRLRPAVLVECPDTETAARVTALGGPQVSAVTRTILRLD
ncbi:MAG: helicase-associated domain-containing protein, partial [Gemmatimonadetes bacterium]|nr:helicase-associated domain-containing protein [Gemmatimonadota bacterium]